MAVKKKRKYSRSVFRSCAYKKNNVPESQLEALRKYGPKKGEVRNPKGRKKGFLNWATVLKEEFKSGKITQREFVRKLIDIALKEKNVRAYEVVMERTDGAAKRAIAIEGLTSLTDLMRSGYQRADEKLD